MMFMSQLVYPRHLTLLVKLDMSVMLHEILVTPSLILLLTRKLTVTVMFGRIQVCPRILIILLAQLVLFFMLMH